MKKNSIPPCMIYIDREGRWFHRGIEMIHEGIVSEFYRSLTTDSFGKYIVALGDEKCFVEVEDTPFIVNRVEFVNDKDSREEISLRLIDGTQEILNPETISAGDGNVLYCMIKNNGFKARFSRAAYYQLASRIKEEGDKYYLPLNDKKYYIKI